MSYLQVHWVFLLCTLVCCWTSLLNFFSVQLYYSSTPWFLFSTFHLIFLKFSLCALFFWAHWAFLWSFFEKKLKFIYFCFSRVSFLVLFLCWDCVFQLFHFLWFCVGIYALEKNASSPNIYMLTTYRRPLQINLATTSVGLSNLHASLNCHLYS